MPNIKSAKKRVLLSREANVKNKMAMFCMHRTVACPRIMSILTHSEKKFSEISKKREEIWMKTKFF